MFDVDDFVARCRSALGEGDRAALAVREEVDRAVDDPGALEATVGPLPTIPAFTTWHRSPELTILHVVWPPSVDLLPHDHSMWAAIGLYGGREDNHFFRRRPAGGLEPAPGGRTLRAGDSITLGERVIHRVANPSREWTGSIHVYGGDYFSAPRSMWPDPEADPVPFEAARVIETLEAAATAARR